MRNVFAVPYFLPWIGEHKGEAALQGLQSVAVALRSHQSLRGLTVLLVVCAESISDMKF